MRAGIKPEIVIQAAAELADRNGWQEVTLGNVAMQLGIKTPSLYNHVDSLNDLRQKLAELGVRILLEQLNDAAIGQSGKQALLEVSRAYVSFVRTHPGLYEAINRVTAPKPDSFIQHSDLIMQLFGRLMQPMEFPAEETVHAVRGLRSLVHGFASLESMGGFQMPVDLDTSLEKIIAYFLAGLDK